MTDERAQRLLVKFGSSAEASRMSDEDRRAWIKRRVAPTTLEEYEWSITLRPNLSFALKPLRAARDRIEHLEGQGWINHGWLNTSPIGALLPDEQGFALRVLLHDLQAKNAKHEMVSFWFGDDDTRTFLLTPPSG